MTSLRAELIRVVRFCEVGAANTAITLAAYAGLLHLGVPGWAASALAFAAGAVNGYFWNARWTFADRRSDDGVAALRARYVAVQGVGTLASAAGVALVHDVAGLAHLEAEVVILPVVTALTFTLMRGYVFAHNPAAEPAAS